MKSALSMMTGDGEVYQKWTFETLYPMLILNLIFWFAFFEASFYVPIL